MNRWKEAPSCTNYRLSIFKESAIWTTLEAKYDKSNFTDKVFGAVGVGLGSLFVGCPAMLVRAAYGFLTDEDSATRNAAVDKIAESVMNPSLDIGKDVVKPGAITVLAAVLGTNINRRS